MPKKLEIFFQVFLSSKVFDTTITEFEVILVQDMLKSAGDEEN